MMWLKEQVCSFELAQKLKELGVPQKSYFEWIDRDAGLVLEQVGRILTAAPTYSAFTVAELGAMIPGAFHSEGDYYRTEFKKGLIGNLWYGVIPTEPKSSSILMDFEGEKEADVRANMLIWLIDNKVIEL